MLGSSIDLGDPCIQVFPRQLLLCFVTMAVFEMVGTQLQHGPARFSLGFFSVVQHPLDCLVHHLDHDGMQLCITWVQRKVMPGYGQICYSCVSKGCMGSLKTVNLDD